MIRNNPKGTVYGIDLGKQECLPRGWHRPIG